jgi:hypothetical protein
VHKYANLLGGGWKMSLKGSQIIMHELLVRELSLLNLSCSLMGQQHVAHKTRCLGRSVYRYELSSWFHTFFKESTTSRLNLYMEVLPSLQIQSSPITTEVTKRAQCRAAVRVRRPGNLDFERQARITSRRGKGKAPQVLIFLS